MASPLSSASVAVVFGLFLFFNKAAFAKKIIPGFVLVDVFSRIVGIATLWILK